MKCFPLLFLLAVAQGLVLDGTGVKSSTKLPAPWFTSMALEDPEDVDLSWTAVESPDPKDPVLGYKLKVWEVPSIKTYKYKIVNGVKTLVEEDESPEFPPDKSPAGTPKEYVTDKTTFTVTKLKFGVTYEFKVQAYTRTMESELSNPFSIRLKPNKHSRDLYGMI